MIRFLLDKGADVDQTDNDGDTPLHHCEHVEAAQILIDANATIDKKNTEGLTVSVYLLLEN